MATNVHRSRTEPYLSVENNIRVSDHEIIWCFVCHDEAVVISNDGTKGLCWDHYSEWCEQQAPEDCDDPR